MTALLKRCRFKIMKSILKLNKLKKQMQNKFVVNIATQIDRMFESGLFVRKYNTFKRSLKYKIILMTSEKAF